MLIAVSQYISCAVPKDKCVPSVLVCNYKMEEDCLFSKNRMLRHVSS